MSEKEARKDADQQQAFDFAKEDKPDSADKSSLASIEQRNLDYVDGKWQGELNPSQEENAIVFERAAQRENQQAQPAPKENENRIVSDELFMSTEANQKMPDSVDRLFLKVGDNKYHFKSSPDDLAFVDKGNKLTTPSNSHLIAETLVRISQQRGWDEIRVTGSESFRREAWYEAAKRGISVRGYTPTEVDKAKLEEMKKEQATLAPGKLEKGELLARSYLTEAPAKALEKAPELAGAFAVREAVRSHLATTGLNEQEKATVLKRIDERMSADLHKGDLPNLNKEERAQGITGTVVDHGAARFNNEENESPSYFVRVETEKGTRTIWGKDLERAINEGAIQKGDKATFRITGKDTVSVNVNVYDKKTGAVVDTKEQQTTRNTWSASKSEGEKTRIIEEKAHEQTRVQQTEKENEI